MANEAKHCARTGCTCLVGDDKKYCSQICEDQVGSASISCDCKHPACSGELA